MDVAGPDRARPSGNSGRSSPASLPPGSTGDARPARNTLSSASGNGRRHIRSGSGSTDRPRCASDPASRQVTKIDRAAVIALAFADLCVRGGERAGLLGLTRPIADAGVVERFAEAIATDERLHGPSESPSPPFVPAAARSMALLIGDFLCEPEQTEQALRSISAQGAIGELVIVVDPIEETYPFSGNVEFLHPDGGLRLLRPRAQNIREAYLARLAAHREALRRICAGLGWGMSLQPHRRFGGGDPPDAAYAPFCSRTRSRVRSRLTRVQHSAHFRRACGPGYARRTRRALPSVARDAAGASSDGIPSFAPAHRARARTRRSRRVRPGPSWFCAWRWRR